MKYIKRDFQSKACVSPPGWTWMDLGIGQKVKVSKVAKIRKRSKFKFVRT